MALDDDLWEPTRLGKVGPTGLVAQHLMGNERLAYMAFQDYHLEPPGSVAGVTARIQKYWGLSAIIDGSDINALLPSLAEVPRGALEERWLAITIRDDDGQIGAYVVTEPRFLEPTIAYVRMWQVLDVKLTEIERNTVWFELTHELALAGFQGLEAFYPDDVNMRRRYRDQLGYFESLGEHIRRRGGVQALARLSRTRRR